MSNKIKLIGVRDLQTEEKLNDNTDYGIFLTAQKISTEIPCTFDDTKSEDDFIYRLKVEKIDQIINLKEKQPVEFSHGKTSSQKLRWIVEQNLGKEEYDYFINYLMSRAGELCDDYRESVKGKVIIN